MWKRVTLTSSCRYTLPRGNVLSNMQGCKVLKREFHTSLPALGRKNRKISKKKFFVPRERFWQQHTNMWRNEMSNETDHIGLISDSLFFPNYPQGDLFPSRSENEIVTKTDRLEEIYYRAYPHEKHAILHRYRPSDKEWYKTPFERFHETFKMCRAQGMSVKNSILFCEQEKKWEQQTIELEREVCRVQAQELFCIAKSDPDTRESNRIEAQYDHDPRIVEYEQKLLRDKLDNLVSQRIRNPRLPKITVKKAGISAEQIIEYIARNSGLNTPDFVKTADGENLGISSHFDESVYFGDYLRETAERIKEIQAEPPKDENEDDLPSPLPENDNEDKDLSWEDIEPKKPVKVDPFNKETIDKQMKDWAKELMSMLSDNVDLPNQTTKDVYDRKTVANIQRIVDRHHLKKSAEETLHDFSPEEIHNNSLSAKEKTNQPYSLSPHLAEELHSLFSNLKK